jgi:hypothetical protein
MPLLSRWVLFGSLWLTVVSAAASVTGLPQDPSSSRVRVVQTPENGQPVVARTDDEGNIHLLFHTPNGPRYARSGDGGKTFSRSLAVVDQAAHKSGLEFHGWDLALGRKGSVHVALGTNAWKLKLPQREWAFHYSRLEPGAEAFSPVRNINEKPSEGFSLAADGRGNVAACWLSGKLFVNFSRDDGLTFGRAVEVDPGINPCDCCTTSAAFGADGRLAILYREETNNERDMYLALCDPTLRKVERSQVSGVTWRIDSCPMTYYSVVRDGEGYITAYPTKGQIFTARLDGKGQKSATGEIKTPGRSGMRTGMIALRGSAGHSLVAWKHEGRLGWQTYNEEGKAIERAGSAPSAGAGAAAAVTREGDFVLFR